MLRSRWFWIFAGLLVLGVVLRFVFGIGMVQHDIHISAAAEPLACIGGERVGEFCSPGTIFPFTNSLLMTILTDLLLVLTIIFGARNMKLIPQGFQNTLEAVIEAFYNFSQGIDRKNVAKFFPLCATIFIFFLYANFIALIPGVGSIGTCVPKEKIETTVNAPAATEGQPAAAEAQAGGAESVFAGLPVYCGEGSFVIPWLRAPAADLNVTLAFAIAAVFMVEVFGFQALGLSYLTKFFNFREGFMGAFVGILELISEFVRIIAFAFRLFGNIFAGEVILVVMSFLFPYLLPLPFYGLEVFVAFIQALVFSILTMVFMLLATLSHGGHDEQGHEQSMPLEAADLPGHGGSH
ncbi:MAG: F0F1 ATP synthase subunit A [Kouleothrix sp.]|nr:F0F1 ATP synthase subunit A [Kouleothrix sp.]